MHRYWIRIEGSGPPSFPGFLQFGITATDPVDALRLLSELFDDPDYEVVEMTEDVLIPDLDQRHVTPNMGNHFRRGVWWPPISRWSP